MTNAILRKRCCCNPDTGACCLPDDSCIDDITKTACETDHNGVWVGKDVLCADTNCANIPNPTPGACCLTDGSCQDVPDRDACTALGGGFFSGQSCADVFCPTGDNTNCPECASAYLFMVIATVDVSGICCNPSTVNHLVVASGIFTMSAGGGGCIGSGDALNDDECKDLQNCGTVGSNWRSEGGLSAFGSGDTSSGVWTGQVGVTWLVNTGTCSGPPGATRCNDPAGFAIFDISHNGTCPSGAWNITPGSISRTGFCQQCASGPDLVYSVSSATVS